ncbi:type II toxin-antitoxin system Phd/YefM family antitoxin [Georgenia sunbinii]|uniref:type II toxin-antitoxin system Phd/YefM family antitoxin n=1 Tax=Georgenia sunbinii TaxID=3117728 RepID=UPI003D9C6848
MVTISASVARQTLPAQLDRVEAGEEVAITRHGRVVAVLVRPDALRARRAPEAWRQADRIGCPARRRPQQAGSAAGPQLRARGGACRDSSRRSSCAMRSCRSHRRQRP